MCVHLGLSKQQHDPWLPCAFGRGTGKSLGNEEGDFQGTGTRVRRGGTRIGRIPGSCTCFVVQQPRGTRKEYQTAKPSGAHHGTTSPSGLRDPGPPSFHLLLSSYVYAGFGDLSTWVVGSNAKNATAGHVGGLRVASGSPGGPTGG